jgi:hypothetical protein
MWGHPGRIMIRHGVTRFGGSLRLIATPNFISLLGKAR